MEYSSEFEDRRVIGVVTEENPKSSPQNTSMNLLNVPQRPMILQMPFMQRFQMGGQRPFPLVFFFFPRIALLLMSQRNMIGQGSLGIRRITQLIRDEKGRIIEITEIIQ